MHDLAKYLTPPLMEVVGFEEDSWDFLYKEFNERVILFATKDGLPTSTQGELEDNQEGYRSITYEKWCDLLTTTEIKDNSNMDVSQIKRLVTSKAHPVNYDRNESVRVLLKKR